MSADNWTQCPKCDADHDAELAAVRASVDASYGVVPPEDYQAALLACNLRYAETRPDTFREDYAWWMEGGTVNGTYSGECSKCRLKVRHETTKTFYPETPHDD